MGNMSTRTAQEGFVALNQNIDATEGYIQDNIAAQNQFNNTASDGIPILKTLGTLAAAIGLGYAVTQSTDERHEVALSDSIES